MKVCSVGLTIPAGAGLPSPGVHAAGGVSDVGGAAGREVVVASGSDEVGAEECAPSPAYIASHTFSQVTYQTV